MTEESANSGAGGTSREATNLADYLSDETATLPPCLEPEEAANRIVALYEESGLEGATFSLYFGDMREQALFAVSIYPDRGLKAPGDTVDIETLQLFLAVNRDLLSDPRCGIGLWGNADVIYYDIVALLPNKKDAITFAVQYDQIAIFDLYALTEIETAGTGNIPVDIPPASHRLPQINPKKEHL